MSTDTLLPPDVLFKVALWIEDSATFFAFLEAIGSLRGPPLDLLWRLGLTRSHNTLWPMLLIENADDESYAALEATSPLYSRVRVFGTCDVASLRRHLGRHVRLEWFNPPLSMVNAPLHEWYADWATLPLTSVVATAAFYPKEPLCTVLPRLTQLQRLEIGGVRPLAAVLAFAADSMALVHLIVNNTAFTRCTLTAPMLDHLIQWLQRQPVKTLSLSSIVLNAGELVDGKAAFCTTVLSCPTLNELRLRDVDLSDLAPMAFVIHAHTVELKGLSVSHLLQLLDPLVAPQLIELDLWACAVPPDQAHLLCLFEALATNPTLQHLYMRHSDLNDEKWHSIVAFLPRLRLKSLRLAGGEYYLSDECALKLALALETNVELKICMCYGMVLSVQGATTLLQCLRRRPVVMQMIAFTLAKGASADQKKTMRERARDMGTTWIVADEI
ncbi:Aste57867_986 [Aphanomyces stellatus]|uniref:Aste57867_986 protein n=1 Tax=Aphanomyces stellatus TaxID=120398 RepID=A0A485K7B8_9STRA|nr:hypothetical protein As57867_000985 [Aphanomyces stellatus]VFT78208.1 Aste57867_986 [Aphanomyces stellatus]